MVGVKNWLPFVQGFSRLPETPGQTVTNQCLLQHLSQYHNHIKPQNIFSAKDDTPPGWQCWCPWAQKPQGRQTERHLPLNNLKLRLFPIFMPCCVTYLNIRHDEFLDARLLKTTSYITVSWRCKALALTSQSHTSVPWHLSWPDNWYAHLKKHHSLIRDV